jgi:hypothetical protein
MSSIRAKPTLYKGTRFRSRLEARWAVFFDAIGWEWVYEPSFAELSGISYQPDFLVETRQSGTHLIEVKPGKSWAELAPFLNEVNGDPRYQQTATILRVPLIMMIGTPGVWNQGRLSEYGAVAIKWYASGPAHDLYEWGECARCGDIALAPNGVPDCCPRDMPTGALYDAFCRVRDESYEDA